MREPLELAQRRKQGLERQAECAAQRERRESVRGIVQSGELHFPYRKERICALREPGLAAALEQTPVLRVPRGVEAEGARFPAGQRHCEAARVIAIEHLNAVNGKATRLGSSVMDDIGM